MKVFAISDLHLSLSGAKPMDIFGYKWENYLNKIEEDWNNKVSEEDVVLISGDISWAMQLDEAIKDISFISKLKGTKIDGKDLRGGASLLIAALCAEGESILTGLKFINRGYENIVNKCQKLGAEIKS
jgi:hypothetical protein